MGWDTSPFEKETGYAFLGFGIAGVLAYFFHMFIPGVVVAFSIFSFGLAWVHISECISSKNHQFKSIAPILIVDILIPITLLSVFWLGIRGSFLFVLM